MSSNKTPVKGVEVYTAFHNIVNFARDLNTQLPIPELVVIGKQGHGKSSFVDALVGHPISIVGKDGSTKRVVHINLVNNLSAEEPIITIKRDNTNPEDKVVSVADLEKELQKRNIVSSTPIIITYEYKYTWNITIIDTPGLVGHSEKSEKEALSDEIEEEVLDLARAPHRILVCVEEVKDNTQSEMIPFAKKVDPKLDRTVFIFNKFSDQVKAFTSTRDLNRYLSSNASQDTQCFFTTLISKDRQNFLARDKFKARLEELVREDLASLEQLQYDRRYASNVGVFLAKNHLMQITWNKYQTSIPELLKRLRAYRKKSEENLSHLDGQLKNLDSTRLRATAARYVMQFLQCIEKLLTGTLEGIPVVNGQTLDEEKTQDDAGDWYNASYAPIKFDPVEWKIPHANSKLYGGQQFERLLAEFKAVVEHLAIEPITLDDIATSIGPQKLNNASNVAWAASDITQRQIHRAMLPLIDQLFKRATFVMKRLIDVVENMLENNRKSKKKDARNSNAVLDDLDQYPYFTHAVKDLYSKFIDQTASECKKKCKDEFYCTRLIYWELTNLDNKTISFDKNLNKEEQKKAITSVVNGLFVKLRDRMVKNILLKSYNFFLVPMQSDLWGEIQGNITCLTDQELQELFEVEATRGRLQESAKDMQQILDKFGERESSFMEFAGNFSRGALMFN